MFISTDPNHQALDMNIGRILEMFLRGDISRDQAGGHLADFYKHVPEVAAPGQLQAYIDAQLDQAGTSTARVRSDLVHVAVMAHEGRDFTAHIAGCLG